MTAKKSSSKSASKSTTKFYKIVVDDTPILQGPNEYENATSVVTSPEGNKVVFISAEGKEVTLIGYKKIAIYEQDGPIPADTEDEEKAEG